MIAAALVNQREFPGPLAVANRLIEMTGAGVLLPDLAKTLLRSFAALLLAMPLGAAVGVALGRVAELDAIFASWVTVGLNLPALIIGVLVYIWLGLTDWSLIIAVALSKVPVVIITIREGTRALDRGFDELARVYRLPYLRWLWRIALPQLLPYVLAAVRNGLGLVWKIVLIFEILGSDRGVGFRIGIMFQHFDVAGILAYAAAFVACVLAIDRVLLVPIDQRMMRWRLS